MMLSLRLARPLFSLAGLAALAACGAPAVAPAPPLSTPTSSPPAAAKPASGPRVVVQPRLFEGDRWHIATPSRVWEPMRENGLTFIDSERNVAVASVFTHFRPSDVAFTPDGEDVLVLSFDPRLAQGGQLIPFDGTELRLLERYNIATRTRRWSRVLPKVSVPNKSPFAETTDHVTASARGIFVTRCRSQPQNACEVIEIGAEDGALGAVKAFTAAQIPSRWGADRADAKGGRFSLRRHAPFRGKVSPWVIIDEEGAIRGALDAICARFDAQDRLWLDGAVEGSLATARALGIQVLAGKQACVPDFPERPPLPMPSNLTGMADLSYPVVTADHVVWQTPWRKEEAFSLDTKAAMLPARFNLPPLDPKVPDSHWAISPTSPEVFAVLGARYAHFGAPDAAPEIEKMPFNAFVWGAGPTRLLGHWPPTSDKRFLLTLGTRTRPGDPIKWRDVEATSILMPGFVLSEDGGKAVLTVAGGRDGLQRVDVASGKRISRACVTPADKDGACSRDEVAGLLASPSGKTAWTYHEQHKELNVDRTAVFEEIDLATGKTARSIPAPRFFFDSVDGYRLRWLEPDRRFWFAAQTTNGHTCAVIASLPTAPGASATYEGMCVSGRALGMEGDPNGRFIASFRGLDTIDFFAPDGEEVLLLGVRGGEPFAQARDGRFACAGAGCEDLRCIVGDEARPVTDAACQSLRAPGFSLVEELAKPRR